MTTIEDAPRPTVEDWKNALSQLEHEGSLPETYKAMLSAHAEAADRTMTATELADAAGYQSFHPVNLHYGRIGKKLSQHLNRRPRITYPSGKPFWTSIHCDVYAPEQTDNQLGHWEWILKPEVADAIRQLGWARDSQANGRAAHGYTAAAEQNAINALPHLVALARQRQTITYQELSRRIGVHHRAARLFLGFIRDEICTALGYPLITVLAVSKSTNLPGESFLAEGTDYLSDEEYRQAFEDIRDEVFAFENWEELLNELGLQPLSFSVEALNEIGRIYSERVAHIPGGEGEPHRSLKKFVYNNPARLGIHTRGAGEMEHLFPSGDCCDVLFETAAGHAIVEIKNGDRHPGELVKGVYQAIKYRALSAAEFGQGEPHRVDVYLVAYQIEPEIIELASKFNITCKAIPASWIDEGSGRG